MFLGFKYGIILYVIFPQLNSHVMFLRIIYIGKFINLNTVQEST